MESTSKAPDFDQGEEYKMHELAHPDGGIKLVDEGNLIPDLVKAQVKRVGKEIGKGQFADLTKLPAPAKFHIPYSSLQLNAYGQILTSHLMNAAKATDPLERLKWVIGYYVGGQHRSVAFVGARIPFNPILGETLQLVGSNGEMFYAEQTSHHPPVTKFVIDGPNNAYQFYGSYESRIKLSGLDSIKGTRVGKIVFTFPDGGQISVKDPTMHMTHLLSSNKVLKIGGTMVITDHINDLVAEFEYAPPPEEKKSRLKSIISAMTPRGRSKHETTFQERSDYFKLRIFETKFNGSRVLRAEGDGTFLSYVQIDGKVYWRLSDSDQGVKWGMVEGSARLLPSDSSLRQDIISLSQGQLEVAEKEKMALEQQQRNDAKIRTKRKK